MIKLFAYIFVAIGMCLGLYSLYFGLWECLIGGIVEIIIQLKAPVLDKDKLLWAIAGIILGDTIAGIGCIFGFLIFGFGINLDSSKNY